jgi:hypothetical protein
LLLTEYSQPHLAASSTWFAQAEKEPVRSAGSSKIKLCLWKLKAAIRRSLPAVASFARLSPFDPQILDDAVGASKAMDFAPYVVDANTLETHSEGRDYSLDSTMNRQVICFE